MKPIKNSNGRMRSKVSGTRRNSGGGTLSSYVESNGPGGVKIKGNVSQVYDRYLSLAKDAEQSGSDRVKVENLMQHADHYLRLMKQRKERSESRLSERNAGGGVKTSRNNLPSGGRRRSRFDDDGGKNQEGRTLDQNGIKEEKAEEDDKEGLFNVLGVENPS